MNNSFDPINNDNEINGASSNSTSQNVNQTPSDGSSSPSNNLNDQGYYYSGPYSNQSTYSNQGPQYGNGYYGNSTDASNYRPPYQPSGYYGNPNAGGGSSPYLRNSNTAGVKKPKPASKGFVMAMVAVSIVISFLLGTVTSAFISAIVSGGDGSSSNGRLDVIIQHVPKDTDSITVTDKGDVAYVASLVSSTVVEVTTETVSTDSYYGQYITQGAGSGVIISSTENGSHIITCAHVIEDATKVTVKLKDGTVYEASEFFCDAESDVGVIKLNVSGLPTCVVGDFSSVVVGEEVVAIGNPLGTLGGSVTNGVISALDRDIIIDGTTYHLLQTNAEINPGNSGGGLFNTQGQLIGIVNAKSSGENVEGLGFAIPIDDAVEIVTDLLEKGYVSGRVKLGFQLIDIQSQDDAKAWWKYSRYFTDYGVYIITSESPAFNEGDLIVAIDDNKIGSLTDLKALLQKLEVGQEVTITVSRIVGNNVKLFNIGLVLQEKTA